MIAVVIDLFDSAVETGTLAGLGTGNAAANRLNALRNMLYAAGDLIAQGELDQACGQLRQVLRRIDGEPAPPDFATGEAADELFYAILGLSDELACDW